MTNSEAVVAHVALASAVSRLATLEARRRVVRVGALRTVAAPMPVLVAPEAAAAARTRAAAVATGTASTAASNDGATTSASNTGHTGRTRVGVAGRRRSTLHAIHGRRRCRIRVWVSATVGTAIGMPIRRLRLRIRVGIVRVLLLTIRSAHAPLRDSCRRCGCGSRRRSGRVCRMSRMAPARVRAVTCNMATT